MASFSRKLLHHLLCTGSPKRGRCISGPTPSFRFCLANLTLKLFEVGPMGMYIGSAFCILFNILSRSVWDCKWFTWPRAKGGLGEKEKSAKWRQMRNRGHRCSQRLLQLEKVLLKLCSWSVMSSDLEFVKKITRPNFRLKEFYTLKTRKSSPFSPAKNSENASLSVQ